MNSTHSEIDAADAAPFGAVIDGEADLDALTAWLRENGIRAVELATGPDQLVGLHLGTVPRHGIRHALAEAGVSVTALDPRLQLRSEHPDEGVVAEIDEHLTLAADVGASQLKLYAGIGLPAEVYGAATSDERVSQRLTAVLPRAAELGVRVVVENSGAASGAAALAAVLDTAAVLAQEAGQVPPAGAVWNVRASVAAGEALAESAAALRPFLNAGNGYIRCESAGSAAALVEALPEVAALPIVVETRAGVTE